MDVRNVLVPVDFAEPSEAALEYAVGLAEQLGARLVVMHAYDLPVYGVPDGALVASTEVASRVVAGAEAALDAMVEPYRGGTVRIDTVLRQGVPWEEVRSVAEELGVDLIVIGTHGRHGLARALLGSVAEKILRTSVRPVLTVHVTTGGAARRRQRMYRAPASSSIPESPVRK